MNHQSHERLEQSFTRRYIKQRLTFAGQQGRF